ncbi:MAG: enoyl-CoA hydratase/isomerase family protein [Pseudomonadota bacterium]|nr:enoyl-CoA hydratase/isomerase family protein [Pseudomonadota bacterium]
MSASINRCVETSRHGEITELQLARPPVNALNPALCADLRDALAAALDDGARGIILSGGPKVFSAGLDVPYLLSLGQDTAALGDAWRGFFDTALALATCPVPIVAAMAGHAPAGGCVLALCCDYRVMGSGADPERPFLIGLNETQVGLVVPDGIQQMLRRVVGAHRAERMLLVGEMVDSARACEIGLVDEVVEPDQVTPRALAWLQSLLALPRSALLGTRAIARADLVEALQPRRIQLDRLLQDWQGADTQQALQALVARLGK